MVSDYRSGAKIAEAPTLVNSNNAAISKNAAPNLQLLILSVKSKFLFSGYHLRSLSG